MSLDDITLNTRVYSVVNVAGSRILRANLAVGGPVANSFEISHTLGAGVKPNRHLIRFQVPYTMPDTVTIKPLSIHVVLTAEKTAGAGDFTNAIEDLTDYLLTSGVPAAILAGSL